MKTLLQKLSIASLFMLVLCGAIVSTVIFPGSLKANPPLPPDRIEDETIRPQPLPILHHFVEVFGNVRLQCQPVSVLLLIEVYYNGDEDTGVLLTRNPLYTISESDEGFSEQFEINFEPESKFTVYVTVSTTSERFKFEFDQDEYYSCGGSRLRCIINDGCTTL